MLCGAVFVRAQDGGRTIEIPTVHILPDPLIAVDKVGIDDLPAIMDELNFLVGLQDFKDETLVALDKAINKYAADDPAERLRLTGIRDQIAIEIEEQAKQYQLAEVSNSDKERAFYEKIARHVDEAIDKNLAAFFRKYLPEHDLPSYPELQGKMLRGRMEAFNARYAVIQKAARRLVMERSARYEELLELARQASALIVDYKKYCGNPNIVKPPDDLEKCRAKQRAIDDLRLKMGDKAKEITDEILEHNRQSRLLKTEVDQFFRQTVRPVVERFYRRSNVAQTTLLAGNVREIDAGGGEPRSLRPEEKLLGAHTYATDATGAVRLTLADQTAVTVGPESRITFEAGLAGERSYQIEPTLKLEAGTLRSSGATNQPHKTIFRTPTTVLKVTGTDFILQVTPDGATILELFDGAVEFTPIDAAKSKSLTAGQSAVIEPNGKVTMNEQFDRAAAETKWRALPGVAELAEKAASSN